MVEQLSLCGATVTVMTPEGGEGLAAMSSDRVEAITEAQFALAQGPSIDSFASGRPVLVPDLTVDSSQWLGFAPVALASGVTGVYAFPLGLGAIRLGVLTCLRPGGPGAGCAMLCSGAWWPRTRPPSSC